jgi:7,8-dihydropterin-6-yl-methyl-4-(beta-D-ribofuranosyl)aminobenzene 5'-phosphate synthase
MKIIIVYDNTTSKPGLIADWGWSCFIETRKRNILFDTGGNGKILLENLLSLKIDPTSIDDVVISHSDFDHIGGLSTFLNLNRSAVVHIPISFHGIHFPNEVRCYGKPTEIYEGIFVTGELDEREQSLAIRTKQGLALIIGCGHPGLGRIMNSVSEFGDVHVVVGGLHGFKEFELLKNIEKVCAAHCTRFKAKIEKLCPDKYIKSGVGEILEI